MPIATRSDGKTSSRCSRLPCRSPEEAPPLEGPGLRGIDVGVLRPLFAVRASGRTAPGPTAVMRESLLGLILSLFLLACLLSAVLRPERFCAQITPNVCLQLALPMM